ncbi:hypothetical protein FEE96_11640 [Parasedimentitalea maritima]|uniref:Zinc ribbon domain-containing protein n=1 Tax=Parasedimentitalea maritima TaxID=2578117 RepID=A0ABY2UUP6_9RHOB|nr:hypothetical protein FEE96_11640 [Zongyanglinia marina]
MPVNLYCWRCEMVVPMLTDQEWGHLQLEVDNMRLSRQQGLLALCKGYERLTGFQESNPSAVFHHVASQYGPPCATCGKPLRTGKASFCAACGESVQ